MFTRSEVVVLTNKQTPLKTPNVLRYATTYIYNSFYFDVSGEWRWTICNRHMTGTVHTAVNAL